MTNVPAGWYPDPAGSPQQRWWDGSNWSETMQATPTANPYAPTTRPYAPMQPYGAVQPYNPAGSYYGAQQQLAPEGTNPTTTWAWLIALWPLIGLINTGISFAFGTTFTTTQTYNSTLSPDVLVTYAISFIAWVAFVLVAYADYRELVNRMVPRPFHWAFAIIPFPIVYVIGRSVVVYSRTRRGLAPLFVWIGASVLTFLVGVGVAFWIAYSLSVQN